MDGLGKINKIFRQPRPCTLTKKILTLLILSTVALLLTFSLAGAVVLTPDDLPGIGEELVITESSSLTIPGDIATLGGIIRVRGAGARLDIVNYGQLNLANGSEPLLLAEQGGQINFSNEFGSVVGASFQWKNIQGEFNVISGDLGGLNKLSIENDAGRIYWQSNASNGPDAFNVSTTGSGVTYIKNNGDTTFGEFTMESYRGHLNFENYGSLQLASWQIKGAGGNILNDGLIETDILKFDLETPFGDLSSYLNLDSLGRIESTQTMIKIKKVEFSFNNLFGNASLGDAVIDLVSGNPGGASYFNILNGKNFLFDTLILGGEDMGPLTLPQGWTKYQLHPPMDNFVRIQNTGTFRVAKGANTVPEPSVIALLLTSTVLLYFLPKRWQRKIRILL